VETRRLRAFVKMIELGTVTRAAEYLGIAQPSLSQQVMDLEAHFKVKLLTRTKRGVTPTPAGEVLYRHANIILRQLKQASLELREASGEVTGSVSLGLAGSLAPVLGVPLLKAVRSQYPHLTLRVLEGSYAFMSELTVRGRLDLALSTGGFVSGLKSELLLTDELVLVMPADQAHVFAEGEPVAVVALKDLPLILPMPLGDQRTVVWDAFAQHELTPSIVGQLESTYDIIRAVREGLGSTLIGWEAARQLAPDLPIRRIVQPRLTRAVYLSEPEIVPSTNTITAVKSLLKVVICTMVGNDNWAGATLASSDSA
jgi:LysR family transcriptional regulator, nitrogen assimilation regulatory protein